MATITIKGKVYNLPPLNTGQIRYHAGPLLNAIQALTQTDDAKAAVFSVPGLIGQHADLLHMALQNEYPHVSLEDVESLTFVETQAAVEAIILASGLNGPQGEAKPRTQKRAR